MDGVVVVGTHIVSQVEGIVSSSQPFNLNLETEGRRDKCDCVTPHVLSHTPSAVHRRSQLKKCRQRRGRFRSLCSRVGQPNHFLGAKSPVLLRERRAFGGGWTYTSLDDDDADWLALCSQITTLLYIMSLVLPESHQQFQVLYLAVCSGHLLIVYSTSCVCLTRTWMASGRSCTLSQRSRVWVDGIPTSSARRQMSTSISGALLFEFLEELPF